MATEAKRMTLDEFHALPETEPPSELICGEVVQKPMPTFLHSVVANVLNALLFNYLVRTGEGTTGSELRHAEPAESRSYLPDISVVVRGSLAGQRLDRGAVERVPDIAIEILSPDDRPARLAEKVNFYLRAGVSLVWVIDPVERTLDVYRPGQPATHHIPPDAIDARPVLEEFTLDLGELFALVDGAVRTVQ